MKALFIGRTEELRWVGDNVAAKECIQANLG